MINKTKYHILIATLIALPSALFSQEVSVKVQYPPVVTTGQQFSVIWTVNSGGGEFEAPSFNPFYKLMGPQTSYSSNTQIINGRMSQTTNHTYMYYLQAVNEGKFIIPPATYTIKNKTYSSDSLFIEVVSDGSSATSGSGNTKNDERTGAGGRDIFVDLIINRNEVYLGEPVTATVKLYTRINISGLNEIKYPQFTGFLKTDLETPPLTSLNQENIRGTVYGTGVVQQFLLYPQKTGEIVIDPVQLTVLIQQKSGQSDPFFGDFFATYQNVPRMVASSPVKIKVNALPGNQPDNYSGVVGKLSLKSSLSRDSVNVNDALNFKITITGSGNLKVAASPSLKLPPDVEIYDPKITEEITNGINGTRGSKSFEYILIPRHYGEFTIPALTYSYFNTSTGKYEQLKSPEYRFFAKKGNEQTSDVTLFGGVSKADVKYLGKDIRFIIADPGKLSKMDDPIISDRIYYSAYLIFSLLFFSVLFIRREHIKRNSDITRVKNRKAGKVASKRLHDAASCLKNNEIDKFYEEILKAIYGYMSDKLNIPVSDMTRNKITNTLEDRGVDKNTVEELGKIMDECEYARYAPSSSGTHAESIFEGTAQFIKKIENSIS